MWMSTFHTLGRSREIRNITIRTLKVLPVKRMSLPELHQEIETKNNPLKSDRGIMCRHSRV